MRPSPSLLVDVAMVQVQLVERLDRFMTKHRVQASMDESSNSSSRAMAAEVRDRPLVGEVVVWWPWATSSKVCGRGVMVLMSSYLFYARWAAASGGGCRCQ